MPEAPNMPSRSASNLLTALMASCRGVFECKTAAWNMLAYQNAPLKTFDKTFLRDIPKETFDNTRDMMPLRFAKRAEHFYSEYRRVRQGVTAWESGNLQLFGKLTENFPKPLLKIGDSTILGRMLDDIDKIPEIDEHIIITNHKFAQIFEDWAMGLDYSKKVTIVDDGTLTNETRLGAVCDLLFAIEKLRLDDDLMVVAADNLLFFSFADFVKFAPGNLAHYLCDHTTMYAWPMAGTGENLRFDIGSIDTYYEACEKFGER